MNKNGINVLSLFDGMSGGQIALERVGIKVNKYYASEIDKHAIKVTRHNYPKTIQLGDVRNIDLETLPKIDLLAGGSPCQSFSFSGRRNGMSTKEKIEITSLEQYLKLKDDGFEFLGQSYLFWEYVRVLQYLKSKNPEIKFILENVKMSNKWKSVLSNAIGVESLYINSNLVSAQNRPRLYWTNIEFDGDVEDKKIALKDVLDYGVDIEILESGKIEAVRSSSGKEYYLHGIANGVRKNILTQIDGLEKSVENPPSGGVHKFDVDSYFVQNQIGINKSVCLMCDRRNYVITKNNLIRKLTSEEREVLQNAPKGFTSSVSEAQRCNLLGNGWTIDVIVEILKNYKES